VAVLLVAFGQPARAVCPDDGATPFTAGPINPLSSTNPNYNGFAQYVQDSEGLALELCLDSIDGQGTPPNCFFDPPDPTNPFSAQIGFGPEAFWWAADASIDTASGLSALVVQAAEAAFLAEDPIDGEQFPFTRLRIRVDVPFTGVYTVITPYGREVFVVEELDSGQEIRESFDTEFMVNTQNQGRVGPWLRWDGTSPAPPAGFVGDGVTPHTVTGSPCGTNFFRVEAVALDGVTPLAIDPADQDGDGSTSGVQTDEFIVIGKILTGGGGIETPLTVDRTTYSRTSDGRVNVFATAPTTATVTFKGGGNLPAGAITLAGDGQGRYLASVSLLDASTLPPVVTVTANNLTNKKNSIISALTDVVTITLAEYDVAAQTLTIEAVSSDQLAPLPTLTANGFGSLTAGSLTVSPLTVAPARVTVISGAGGSHTVPVAVINTTTP
jgi:hypothetical protein